MLHGTPIYPLNLSLCRRGQAEREARDLYWSVISEDPRDKTKLDANMTRLQQVHHCPSTREPQHVRR